MATIKQGTFENADGDEMVKLQQDGIDFNNVPTGAMRVSSIIGKANSYTTGGSAQYPIVSAIDIDWNNANMGNSYYINTTGQLLSYISSQLNAKGSSASAGDITSIRVTFD